MHSSSGLQVGNHKENRRTEAICRVVLFGPTIDWCRGHFRRGLTSSCWSAIFYVRFKSPSFRCPYDRSDRKGKLKFFSAEAIQINRYFADSPTDIITLLLENRPDLSEQLMKWSVEVTLVGRTDVIYGGWIDARR